MAKMPSSSLQGRIYGVSVWTVGLGLPGSLYQDRGGLPGSKCVNSQPQFLRGFARLVGSACSGSSGQ